MCRIQHILVAFLHRNILLNVVYARALHLFYTIFFWNGALLCNLKPAMLRRPLRHEIFSGKEKKKRKQREEKKLFPYEWMIHILNQYHPRQDTCLLFLKWMLLSLYFADLDVMMVCFNRRRLLTMTSVNLTWRNLHYWPRLAPTFPALSHQQHIKVPTTFTPPPLIHCHTTNT